MACHVIPATRVRLPYISETLDHLHWGFPVHPVKSMLRPSLGMSAVTVCDALNALLITTSSCGKVTREVQPCVDQVNEAVPVAVCVADTVAFVVTAPALPSASPM